MASIAQTSVKPQGSEDTPSKLSEADSYRLVVRFGRDLLSDGFTAIPNLLLDLYAELGISHCELVFLLHLMQYKWSKAEPYPSLGTIAQKMGLSLRAVQNHVHSLSHKAWRCPHTGEAGEQEDCTCPKYLVVSHRYRPGVGQTSSSYNLSGLFAALLTLAREKGLLPAADRAKKCTPPGETSCMGGMKKPAYESDVSKNTQSEPDESSSNALGGEMAESTPTCRHGAHGVLRKEEEQVSCSHEAVATRNAEGQAQGKTEKESQSSTPSSKENMNTHSSVSPSSPNRNDSSNLELSCVQETGRPGPRFFRKDEVRKGVAKERVKPEPPRLSAPPLTQEDMDQRIRERLARERARAQMQNPLPGIIRDEDWNTLEKDHPTTSLRCKPMPVYPRLQHTVERISEKLGDFHHAKSNITRTDNIRREAGVELPQLLAVLEEAAYATHTAEVKGRITKRDESGRLVKMSYFFAVVRQKLGLPPKTACTE